MQAQKQTGFLVAPRPDCVFDGRTRRLFFVSLHRLYRFFPGLSRVTEEERKLVLDQFTDTKFAGFDERMTYQRVSKTNLHHIVAASEKINRLSAPQRTEMIAYARQMYPDLQFNADTDRFVIHDNTSLRMLLDCVYEKCYRTPVTGRKCRAVKMTELDEWMLHEAPER